MSWSHFHLLHRRLAPWLILLLLVAQGLRICIPDAGDDGHHDAVVHLESLLTSAADQHESGHDSGGDTDLTISASLKLFGHLFAAGALMTATLYVADLPDRRRFYWPDDRCLRSPQDCGIAPPLRAPPR